MKASDVAKARKLQRRIAKVDGFLLDLEDATDGEFQLGRWVDSVSESDMIDVRVQDKKCVAILRRAALEVRTVLAARLLKYGVE